MTEVSTVTGNKESVLEVDVETIKNDDQYKSDDDSLEGNDAEDDDEIDENDIDDGSKFNQFFTFISKLLALSIK